jgi:hypothetical protein
MRFILLLVVLATVALEGQCLDLGKALDSGKEALVNSCITDDNCNTEFFKIRNYCCKLQCCDWITYVFKNSE